MRPPDRLIAAEEFVAALKNRGLVPPATRRVVIDAEAGCAVRLYFELVGDDRLLEVFQDPSIRIEKAEPT